ncbi:MAG: Ig-like domain-containing protein [Christensenellales bacterium]|jgi:hypothetical protein
MKRLVAALLLGMLFASVLLTGALGMPAERAAFTADWRAPIKLDAGVKVIEFTPEVNSLYDVGIFPTGACEITSARITRGGRVIAAGDGRLIALTARLTAGQKYTLVLEGTGSCVVELMRRMPGRSFAMPEEMAGGAAGGLIVRPGNAVWYAFRGDGGPATVYLSPGEGAPLALEALIYDKNGVLAAKSIPLPGGACAAYIMTDENAEYRMRIASPAGGRGSYAAHVALGGADAALPRALQLITGDLSMRAGGMRSARVRVEPEGALQNLIWVSSNPAVAAVTQTGLITAIAEGEAVVSVYAYGGLNARLNVAVARVEPEDIFYFDMGLTLRVDDVTTPKLTVYPAAAAGAAFEYQSSAPDIAAVSEAGEVTALSEGEAVITARYGALEAQLSIRVASAPARYRALLVSEQAYPPDVNTMRTGAVNTVYNLDSLLGTVTYENGVGCETRIEVDLTREELLDAIGEAFADAKDDDVSILYISSHGYYRDGMSMLQLIDGSELAAGDLERALRAVPGTIVLMIDSCDSGGFIGTYEEMTQFTGGITAAFSGEAAPFGGSKYKVLASAALMQDSYRLGYGESEDEGSTATVFIRALSDGSGWNMVDQRKGPLNADTDYDGKITLWEAYLYTSRRVRWHLAVADGGAGIYAQDVQVYPKGDNFVLFAWEDEP